MFVCVKDEGGGMHQASKIGAPPKFPWNFQIILLIP